MQIDIKEASHRLGKSEKTLRRWVHEGRIAAHLEEGRLMFAVQDIEAHQVAPSDRQRIEALEYHITELENRIHTLERLYELEHQKPTPPRKTSPRPAQAQKQGTEGDTLPDGFVPIYDLIKQYNLLSKRQAILRYMRKYGFLKTGHWKRQGHEVRHCLDQAGVSEFLRRYVTKDSLTHG